MTDKSTMQLLLEARFQQLAEEAQKNHEMPDELREEVFRTLEMIEQNNTAADLDTEKTDIAPAATPDTVTAADD